MVTVGTLRRSRRRSMGTGRAAASSAARSSGLGEDRAQAVSRDATLDAEIGALGDDSRDDEAIAGDLGHDVGAFGELARGVEGPVGVRDGAIDTQEPLSAAEDDAAEDLGARAADERKLGRDEAAAALGGDTRRDDVAVEEGVQIGGGDERGDRGRAFDDEEPEPTRVNGDTPARRVFAHVSSGPSFSAGPRRHRSCISISSASPSVSCSTESSASYGTVTRTPPTWTRNGSPRSTASATRRSSATNSSLDRIRVTSLAMSGG